MTSSISGVHQILPWFWPLVFAFLGAVVASFSGVVVDRLPEMRGWKPAKRPARTLSSPPSQCDHCKRRLSFLDLVPVLGWIAAQGRCGQCGHTIPVRYPVIEAATALISLALVAWHGPTPYAIALTLLLWWLVLVSWLDWEEHEIPDMLTVPVFFLAAAASPFEPDVHARLFGAMVAGGFMWLAFKLTGSVKKVDAMAYGDVALVIALGALLGWCGIPALLLCSALSYVAYALPLRRHGVVWVPMGPALALGFFITALFNLKI